MNVWPGRTSGVAHTLIANLPPGPVELVLAPPTLLDLYQITLVLRDCRDTLQETKALLYKGQEFCTIRDVSHIETMSYDGCYRKKNVPCFC